MMQVARPRAIFPLLQLGLALQVHRQFGTRFLVYVFCRRRIGHLPIKYQNLKHLFCEEDNTISIFWSCTWLLKPERPSWNGFMKMIHTGSHPRESSVGFMPIIDLNSMMKQKSKRDLFRTFQIKTRLRYSGI